MQFLQAVVATVRTADAYARAAPVALNVANKDTHGAGAFRSSCTKSDIRRTA
jgi:hypothetical protein